MITPEELNKLYNPTLIIIDKFLSDIVEPKLINDAKFKKSSKIPIVDYSYYGYCIELDEKYKVIAPDVFIHNGNLSTKEFTNSLIEKLEELNFKTSIETITHGDDHNFGRANLIISWETK